MMFRKGIKKKQSKYPGQQAFQKSMVTLIGPENIEELEKDRIFLFHESCRWHIMLGLDMGLREFSQLERESQANASELIGETRVESLIAENVIIVKVPKLEERPTDEEETSKFDSAYL